ncbi:retrovirus-related pol polyprotein from transposon TNT 1-94 [Tanacetum coccineum]
MGMVDNTLFTKKRSSNLIIVQIYVDDIIFGSTCKDMCDEFANIMHDKFEMSMMGELNFFLGLQIKQMEDGIFFNQSKYIKEMLKKFGLEESKPMKTPMSSDTKLTKDEECESVDSTKYRGMIGSLLYLTVSRPDIMFSVCLCARFQEAPKTSHLEAVKRIFRYIKGTMHLGLWYPKRTGIETVVYADSDHAGDYVDRKSTSGICTFMGCCLTSWFSKKQTALAISTTEAEYVSAGKACQQALWMKQDLIDCDVRLDDVSIMCDNQGAFDLSKNPVQHSRTKHIEMRHHFLRDNVQKGHISIKKVRQNAVQNDGNEVGKNAVQNPSIQIVENMNGLSVVSEIANQYGNGNVVTASAKDALWEETDRVKIGSAEVIKTKETTYFYLSNCCSLISGSMACNQIQNRRDLPMNTPLDRKEVLCMIEKRSKVGIVPTEMELVLEQTQQGMEADESDNPDDIAEIFKIEGNLFDFEKPLCKAFNEFNYLLKIDTDLFTFDIQGNQTYEEYELNNTMTRDLEEPWLDNGVPYQLCDHICKPYRFNNGMTKWPTRSSDIDGFCNGGELPRMVRVGSMTYFQDHKLYDELNYGTDNAYYTQDNLEHKKEHHDPSTCRVRRFEMIKYSFDADDEYVAIKEHECSKHSETNIDTCQAYREIFRIMDEGWLMTKACDE